MSSPTEMTSTFLTVDHRKETSARLVLRGDLLFLFGAGMLFLLVFHSAASSIRFQYDEADYMAAARMGFRENYLETSSMSFPAYLKAGLQAVSQGIDRTDLSESVRQRKDVSFYRHYHGPLYFHWLALMTRMSTHESWLRAAGLTFHLLTFATIFIGILALFGAEGRSAAWIASSAYLFSVTNIRTSLVINTHPMYVWLAVLALFAIARFLVTARPKDLLLSIACATVALCVLEYGVLLFVTLAACTLLMRRQLLSRNHALRLAPAWGKGVLLFLTLCALLWPAGLFKLSMLKAYLALPYLMFMRRDSFGMTGFLDLWSQRLSQSPLEYAILILCAVATVGIFRNHDVRAALLPFALYAGLILIPTAKSDTDRYMSSAIPALYVVGGVVLADRIRLLSPATRAGLFSATCLVLLLNAANAIAPPAAEGRADENDTVGFVRSNLDRLRTVMVPAPWVPTLQYYVPEVVVRSYLPDAAGNTEHLRSRLARTPVDALFVCREAEARLALDREQRFQAERVAGPETADPACSQFIVYFFTHQHGGNGNRP
jgi:hypothetical protein